jgi:Ni/Co efflux regulator RcnB
MKYKTIVSAVMAAVLTTGGFAFAQGRGDREDRGRNEQSQRSEQHRDNQMHKGQRGENHGRSMHEERREGRGAGPNHAFYRGERLPAQYRHRQYVVNDWRSHNLSAPPRGYHWVQTGSDYVLVAIATGIILQLFLN